MSKYVFLYKENSDDRDCCAYIEAKPMRWECGHYFGGVNLNGSCYCGHTFAPYEDIKTILTEEEYNQLIKFSNDIHDLGFGIKEGDERYNKGVELCKSVQNVYDKLLSEEAQEFFEQILEEEREYLMDEYSLDEEDIDTIFDNYGLNYRDRSVVGYVYKDEYDLGYEEAWALGYVNQGDYISEKYFDFEAFGEDLANDEYHCKLSDGRIVSLNY